MKPASLSLLTVVAILSSCTPVVQRQDATLVPDLRTQNSAATQSAPSSETNSQMGTTDLSVLASAWSSHNVDAIRALYTDDGRYFTSEEMSNLRDGRPIHAAVKDASFLQRAQAYEGFTMRILGEPIVIYDKLIAFTYRWEGDSNGYSGAGLLRIEGGKILLHTDLTSLESTPNQDDNTHGPAADLDLSGLLGAWNNADLDAAASLYRDNAVVLSDEDLAQAQWRDFSQPPGMDELLVHFRGWKPAVMGAAVQVDNLVIFAWHWGIHELPVGSGVRLLRYHDSAIDTDIRFAIRPWEPRGKLFLTP